MGGQQDTEAEMKANARNRSQRRRTHLSAKEPAPFAPPSTYNGWTNYETVRHEVEEGPMT